MLRLSVHSYQFSATECIPLKVGLRLARGLIALGFHPWAWNSAGIKARDEFDLYSVNLHSCTLKSELPLAIHLPSGLKATSLTSFAWFENV